MDDREFESYYGMTKDEAIAHYGVKGMKWGVIRDRVTAGRSRSKAKEDKVTSSSASEEALVAKFKAVPPNKTPSKKQQQKNLAENQAKFDAKFGPDPPGSEKKKGWRPTPKQIAWGITGAVVVGGIAYSAYRYRTRKPGEAIPEDVFQAFVAQSKQASWGGQGFIKPSSYNQKEFTLPAGHTFHRISKVAEEGYRGATYATHNIDDYNRYLTAFRGELGDVPLKHLTFTTKTELKVPSLAKRLEVMHTVMQEMDAKRVLPAGVTRTPITPKDALDRYTGLSGGSWDSPTAKSFFEALRKQGYGAIVDDMDAGVIGQSPLVVFATEMLSEKKASPITSAEILNAAKSLTEIDNRKTFNS